MVQKINHTSNQVNSSLSPSAKAATSAPDKLSLTESGRPNETLPLNQAGIAPIRPHSSLAGQLSHLMQRIISLDPHSARQIQQLLSQLLPTTPAQMLTLLSQLLVHPKHKFQGVVLLWLSLKKQQKLDPDLSTELGHLVEKMQLKQVDQSNQQIWLLQLPWLVEQQLKPLQLKLVKPKTKQGKRKWQLKLKLPTKHSEILADCWLDDTEIDLKIYCDNARDLEQVDQHSPLLIKQLNQAGFNTSCQHFMGQVTTDLVAEFDDNSPHLDILV
ncbi:hypothetical protein [Motilimonas sp. KMU-193]|uniref:hypothetical protein n=1 Tax=Motilimonas sp. KMU-193 TaxID=3388668 RepID=UPI00396B2679